MLIPLPVPAQRLIVGLLLLYPPLTFVHSSGASASLHLLAILGLYSAIANILTPQGRTGLVRFWREYGVLCVAMLAPLIANLLGKGLAGNFENIWSTPVQRAVFAGFALLALLSCRRQRLAMFQWGAILGLVVTTVMLLHDSQWGAARPRPEAHNLLNYTNVIVLLVIAILYFTHWRLSRFITGEFLLKILAVGLGIYAIFLSQSRGPLLSAAVLLGLYFLVGVRWRSLAWRLGVCVLALAMLGLTVAGSGKMRSGLEKGWQTAVESLPTMAQGGEPTGGDSSSRIRLGLWQASWLMFKEHPWVGDGSHSFSDRLAALNKAGLVSDEVTWKEDGKEAFSQPHNEVANVMATRGVAGLLALLLLYLVPLHVLLRQRARTDRFGRVAADIGIMSCLGFILFGLTVTVLLSGWMMAHYAILVSLFIALSRPPDNTDAHPETRYRQDGRLQFPASREQKFLRGLYRTFNGRQNRHNSRLWPYIRLDRNDRGGVEKLSVSGYEVPLVTIQQAFSDLDDEIHIVLSGPSVAEIDYSRLPALPAMGVNGSILLQDKASIAFPFYCLIDRTFVFNRLEVVRRIVADDRVLFLPVDVLRYILETIPIRDIHCRFCIAEDLTERAYEPTISSKALRQMADGPDLAVFNEQTPLGFSLDPDLGWFDADTVAYAALQVAVWGGARRVFLHGLDIKGAEAGPRFYDEGGRPLGSRLEQNFETLIEPSFRQAVILLAERGVQVCSLSPDSALGPEVIPFLSWQQLMTTK